MFSNFKKLLARHGSALGYVLREILPILLKTGRRPVLFLQETGLGDALCTVPAARELRKRHPGATFIYNCKPNSAAVPALFGIAERVTSLADIGLVRYWYRFLTAGIYRFAHGNPYLVQTMMQDFCRQFNVPAPVEHPHLDLPLALKERGLKILAAKKIDAHSFITIHAGPTLPVREWLAENWTVLVARLQAQGFRQIVQLGAGHDAGFGRVTAQPVPGAISFLDELSFEESLAVIALARLHIGIDSGLLHMAAVVNTPAVGIFGNTLPEYRFSENYRRNFVVSPVACRGCGHWLPATPFTTNCPNEICCMKQINVDSVLKSALNVLAAQPFPATLTNQQSAM